MAGPAPADEKFADFLQKLAAGAIQGQQYARAWAALAALFGAASAQLLRGQALPAGVRGDGPAVRALDLRTAPLPLPRGIWATDAEHALLATMRVLPRGVDAVLVLRNGKAFSAGERAWMELLLGHIRSALELGEQLASSLPTVASVVQLARLVPLPCVLTDEEGRCMLRNHAFDRVLEAVSGVVRGGVVVFDDPFLQDSWCQALREGRNTAAAHSLLATTAAGEEWHGHVVPLSCVSSPVRGDPRQLMLAVFERSTAAGLRQPPVASSSPLTRAELEVLASLMLGQTAKVIASTRGASVHTVRSQIAAILAKTGHHSQKKLIASFAPLAIRTVVERG
jgi:DNA-binding CsgD family transcriptional regulator